MDIFTIDFFKKFNLPKKFKSPNKLDKYIANFIINIHNYSLIHNIDYIELLITHMKDVKDYNTSLIAAIIYLDYDIFNKFQSSYKFDVTYMTIESLLYKIFKHDNNYISINKKMEYLKNYYKINTKLIDSYLYIFKDKLNIKGIFPKNGYINKNHSHKTYESPMKKKLIY